MNREIVTYGVGSILALLMILVAVGFAQNILTSTSDTLNTSYQDSHTYTYGVGETATLNSFDDEEGLDYGWQAAFDWEGTFEVTLADVVAHRDPSGKNNFSSLVSPEAMELIADDSSPLAFVETNLHIKNIDATPRSYDDGQVFNISVFSLQESVTGDIPFVELGDTALENPTEHDALNYYLAPGKEGEIKIGWFVNESDLDNGLALIAGITGIEKYIFSIAPEDIREG